MSRRIGEILIELGLVTPAILERALVRQRTSQGRLCTLLVEAGVISFDHAARALGELHGVHAILAKHLDGRERELAGILPMAIAHGSCALPIGRLRSGAVVVCVRDPSDAMAARLTDATGEAIVLAVAPAGPLARAVAETYPTTPAAVLAAATADGVVEGYDIDMSSGPIPTFNSGSYEVDLSTGPMPTLHADDDDDDEARATLGSLAALSLVGLDDRSVTRDASQAATQFGRRTRTELPPSDPASPPLRPSSSSLPPPTGAKPQLSSLSSAGLTLPRTTTPPPGSSLRPTPAPRLTPPPTGTTHVSFDQALALIAVARTLPQATEAAMAFAADRWTAALLLRLQGGVARGELGHGARLPIASVFAVSVPLDEPSLVTAALYTPGVIMQRPAGSGALQDGLEGLLGLPRAPAASTARIGDQVAYVLLVGDPTSGDDRSAGAELGQLMHALGAACARIATRA